jgi:hypothetical protein
MTRYPQHARDPRTWIERVSLFAAATSVGAIVLATMVVSFLYLTGIVG